jgi:hypothetical protein
MGTSTDAKLVYGIPLSEETEIGEWNDGDPESGPAWIAWSGEPHDGVTLTRHCSDGCVMYILALEGTETTAWRGQPVRIKPKDLHVDGSRDEKLRAYAKRFKLKTKGKPGWWLCSWWG